MAKNNKKGKKIITAIATLSAVAGTIFAGKIFLENQGFNFGGNSSDKLQTVQNLNYDEKQNKLSWDVVDNATGYIADINGEQQNVDENYLYYVPTSKQTQFKVQAIDKTGNYFSSDWSNTITYTLSNEFSYSNLYMYIKNHSPVPFDKIVNVNVNNSQMHVCLENSLSKSPNVYNITMSYDEFVNSIEDCMKYNCDTKTITQNLVNYDSIKYLLKSNSYDGELEKARQEGYDISVISSSTAKVDSTSRGAIDIYSTLKLTKDKEVKYCFSQMRCYDKEITNDEYTNYCLSILKPSARDVEEIEYTELKGDEIKIAQEMENIAQHTQDSGYEM